MNKKIVLITLSIFVVSIMFSGCTGPKTVETPGGKVTVEEGNTGPEWCKAGTKVTTSGQGQEGSYEIKGITKYKGKDVCEAVMTVSGQGEWKYYFTEDYKYATIVMKDSSGNEQEMVISNPNP